MFSRIIVFSVLYFLGISCSYNSNILGSFIEQLDDGYTAAHKIGLKRGLGAKGQQLVVTWSLPRTLRSELPIELDVSMRYENGTVIKKNYHITSASGTKIYPLEGVDFQEKGGIAAYNLILRTKEREIANRKHHLWTEIIMLSDFEK